MRKTVGILDDMTEYGQRLAAAINARNNKWLRATYIRDPFETAEKVKSEQIHLLLVSERHAWQMEDASVPLFILKDEMTDDTAPDPGSRSVSRYRPVTDIINSLLSEGYIEKKSFDEKIITVFSPNSVEIAMNLGIETARTLAGDGRTLLLPFDNFYGDDGRRSITELLYTGLGSRSAVTELLTEGSGESYDSFGGPTCFSDLWQYSEEQMNRLLDTLSDSVYAHVVIVAGYMSDAVYTVFKRSDAIIVPDMASVRGQEFLRQMGLMEGSQIPGKVREYL